MSLVEITFPEIAKSELPAKLVGWKKKVGDAVSIGETVAEVETSKVVMEIPSNAAGVLVECFVTSDGEVSSKQAIGVISTNGFEQTLPPPSDQEQRMAKYCCPEMYFAATDENAKTKFSFHVFRGEPCWDIGGDICFASYCPWCGKRLPDRPFES